MDIIPNHSCAKLKLPCCAGDYMRKHEKTNPIANTQMLVLFARVVLPFQLLTVRHGAGTCKDYKMHVANGASTYFASVAGFCIL